MKKNFQSHDDHYFLLSYYKILKFLKKVAGISPCFKNSMIELEFTNLVSNCAKKYSLLLN